MLAKEVELVKVMLQEGLLDPTDAEELLDEIGVDTAEIAAALRVVAILP